MCVFRSGGTRVEISMGISMMIMKQRKHLRGLTLIELVIAMAIFSILMVSAAHTFTSGILSFKMNTATERDVESISTLMNQMAKEIRTSTIADYTGSSTGAKVTNPSSLTYYDYSQGKCVRYTSSSGNLTTAGIIRRQEKMVPTTTFTTIATDCSSAFGAAIDVTPADTRLNLVVNESIPGKVGGAQITFTLNSSTKPVQIRSFVSSRDYKKSGL